MSDSSLFARMESPGDVWAVGSIRGDAGKLQRLHSDLESRVRPGDTLIYLGNVIGWGERSTEAVDEVERFRGRFLALSGGDDTSWIALRGRQEELFERVLNLEHALNPVGLLIWAIDQGAGATLAAYGVDPHEGLAAAARGPAEIRNWTGDLAERIANAPGHMKYLANLKSAAFTTNNAMVFVHTGLQCDRPLDAQGDCLWWNPAAFEAHDKPYFGTRRIVRGFDPQHRGIVETKYSVSIDGGCGRGGVGQGHEGSLIAAKLNAAGSIAETISA